jgi:hypothetical protein
MTNPVDSADFEAGGQLGWRKRPSLRTFRRFEIPIGQRRFLAGNRKEKQERSEEHDFPIPSRSENYS